jgi:hypothetical protein
VVPVPPPTSVTAAPYVPTSAPAYPPPFYPGYGYPYYNIQPPAAANLEAMASLTSATGQYWNDIQKARITREQSRQMAMDTQRKQIEFELWYEGVRPTAPKMKAAEAASDLDWARNNPPNTEIWSGRTLNVLLRSIFSTPEPGRGPTIPLDPTTLRGLNLTDMTTRGNLALAKDEGQIDWTEALQGAAFDSVRDSFSRNFATAIKSANSGAAPPIPVVRDLRAELTTLSNTLDDQARDLSPDQYIEARRLVNKLKDTVKGLGNARLCKACNDGWKKEVHTVSDLVSYCLKNGLEFAPAMAPGDYPSYTAAYYALRTYERSTVLTASR